MQFLRYFPLHFMWNIIITLSAKPIQNESLYLWKRYNRGTFKLNEFIKVWRSFKEGLLLSVSLTLQSISVEIFSITLFQSCSWPLILLSRSCNMLLSCSVMLSNCMWLTLLSRARLSAFWGATRWHPLTKSACDGPVGTTKSSWTTHDFNLHFHHLLVSFLFIQFLHYLEQMLEKTQAKLMMEEN